MSTCAINYLNIALMLVAWLAAVLLPFELFVFSYAFLGPLHYLTEILWLHKRNYFVPRRSDWWVFGAIAIIVVAAHYFPQSWSAQNITSLYLAFAAALLLVVLRSPALRVLAGLVVIASAFLVSPYEPFQIFILLLPTIIHVFVFTGAFLLLGALRERLVSGGLAFAIYLGLAMMTLLLSTDLVTHLPTTAIQNAYGFFKTNNALLIRIVDLPRMSDWSELFTSPSSIRVTRFIAFAYTYHYLNWFSKTSIIGWHRIPRSRIALVVVLWLSSVAVYLASFEIGFYLLSALSLMHVILEFPLNHQSFLAIGRELGNWKKSPNRNTSTVR